MNLPWGKSKLAKDTPPPRPWALLVDDDEDFNKMMVLVLKKIGVHCLTTTNSKDFLIKLREQKPDLCLIDLNIEDFGVGFTLIQAVRRVLGPQLPLFVVSGESDKKAIAHAVEVGANDYITKPLDRDIITSKLSRYLRTEQLQEAKGPLFPVPEGGVPALIELDFNLNEIDEFGMRLSSKHLLNKGSVYYISSPLLSEITGTKQPLLYTIASTEASTESQEFNAYAEFDATNQSILVAVRRWLVLQRSLSEGSLQGLDDRPFQGE